MAQFFGRQHRFGPIIIATRTRSITTSCYDYPGGFIVSQKASVKGLVVCTRLKRTLDWNTLQTVATPRGFDQSPITRFSRPAQCGVGSERNVARLLLLTENLQVFKMVEVEERVKVTVLVGRSMAVVVMVMTAPTIGGVEKTVEVLVTEMVALGLNVATVVGTVMVTVSDRRTRGGVTIVNVLTVLVTNMELVATGTDVVTMGCVNVRTQDTE
uniref:Uncharacterized protein n=1 Tax=Anopheles atroparvus TaxID=41427 RepID=A0A182JCZ1_ANOAO